MNVKKCCEDPKYRKRKRGDDINVSVLFCPDDAIVCRNYFNFICIVHGPSGSPNGGRIRTNFREIEKREREIIYLGGVMEIIVITLIVKMPH